MSAMLLMLAAAAAGPNDAQVTFARPSHVSAALEAGCKVTQITALAGRVGVSHRPIIRCPSPEVARQVKERATQLPAG